MKKLLIPFAGLALLASPAIADVPTLSSALVNVHNNCVGISEDLARMRQMAGIGTAITGVGAAAGAGAVIVGIQAQRQIRNIHDLELQVAALRHIAGTDYTHIEYLVIDRAAMAQQIAQLAAELSAAGDIAASDIQNQIDAAEARARQMSE